MALAVLGAGLAAGLAVGVRAAAGQTSVTLMEPSVPLLPEKFGEWKKTAATAGAAGNSLAEGNKDVMAECGLLRSQAAVYSHGGRTVRVEAIELGDRTGAYSAFTFLAGHDAEGMAGAGMTVGKELGANDAVGAGADGSGVVLFTVGSSVVRIYGL